ncbi:hypothetical protein [Phreatobacter oligotrophus]|uniref:Uncharacterized protein n=1 Tax=Phreatobacter oligotrophus TaxID=1122261 RepID=A0A2T4ZIS4_9HYPH|nr:hypothetical protein [Phreatobacter oligotrophus]PTM61871.1 hypothetical protein C8P69_101543 [Phreatobacter oligotrophus]
MPIRPENRRRYPADWKTVIVPAIRARSGNRCEEPSCGVRNGSLGGRLPNGRWLPADPTGDDGLRLTWPAPGTYSWCSDGDRREPLRIIRIVLTVAHLDHDDLETRDLTRLRHWCQRCHNRYDARHRAAGIRARRRATAAAADLFIAEAVTPAAAGSPAAPVGIEEERPRLSARQSGANSHAGDQVAPSSPATPEPSLHAPTEAA